MRALQGLCKTKPQVPLVGLSVYGFSTARLLAPHVDFLLVGDSLAMTLYGYENTFGVSLELMIAHAQAVRRGAPDICVVVDLPFGSYQESPVQAFRSASRMLSESGCDGVKLEGGTVMAETIAFLTQRGIPVMGHIGLTPQFALTQGGWRVRGREESSAQALRLDAAAVQEAGALCMVVETVQESLAREITQFLSIPTIGIGASAMCDGQILVCDDLVGLFTEFTPRFVKRYADLRGEMSKAASSYAREVRARVFPARQHCFFGGRSDVAGVSGDGSSCADESCKDAVPESGVSDTGGSDGT